MNKIINSVKNGALIQGGSFRLDLGPTKTEADSFRLAATLLERCKRAGKQATLGCIVNDLAVNPEARPKATGRLEIPQGYLEILRASGLCDDEARLEQIRMGKGSAKYAAVASDGLIIRIFYETSLRNAARKDPRSILVENEETGLKVPRCPAIMGKFYDLLANSGYTQQIGFYAYDFEPCDDHVCCCPRGPTQGAIKDYSGYSLSLEVINFWVYSNGSLVQGFVKGPEG